MAARTKARKRALDILFESELQGRSTGATLVDRQADNDPPINPYTVELVDGVDSGDESRQRPRPRWPRHAAYAEGRP